LRRLDLINKAKLNNKNSNKNDVVNDDELPPLYELQTIESNIRQLGDLLFVMQQYEHIFKVQSRDRLAKQSLETTKILYS